MNKEETTEEDMRPEIVMICTRDTIKIPYSTITYQIRGKLCDIGMSANSAERCWLMDRAGVDMQAFQALVCRKLDKYAVRFTEEYSEPTEPFGFVFGSLL